ncbi:hypothetical protein PANI_CDS0015 [Maribacter phage Panino]
MDGTLTNFLDKYKEQVEVELFINYQVEQGVLDGFPKN